MHRLEGFFIRSRQKNSFKLFGTINSKQHVLSNAFFIDDSWENTRTGKQTQPGFVKKGVRENAQHY